MRSVPQIPIQSSECKYFEMEQFGQACRLKINCNCGRVVNIVSYTNVIVKNTVFPHHSVRELNCSSV